MTPAEETAADLWATGASPTSHPVQHARGHLTRLGATTTADIRLLHDRTPALTGGLVTHSQRPPTAKGTVFLNIEDETGMINVIVPPHVWDRYHQVVLDHPGLLIHGTAERAGHTINVLAHRLEPLTLTGPARAAPVPVPPPAPQPWPRHAAGPGRALATVGGSPGEVTDALRQQRLHRGPSPAGMTHLPRRPRAHSHRAVGFVKLTGRLHVQTSADLTLTLSRKTILCPPACPLPSSSPALPAPGRPPSPPSSPSC
ncbi:hypothetical protein GCM10010387_50250 [Streptomyces inusitatus]|uniref:OB domain-containing protein n=1 Tax=Streptomyces inusitatus TaxID=68221 RepID=A0A918QHH5_9ACTN|nr:hypothetical protein GCM10010387_50250 [Streptomyces inusitatus]